MKTLMNIYMENKVLSMQNLFQSKIIWEEVQSTKFG